MDSYDKEQLVRKNLNKIDKLIKEMLWKGIVIHTYSSMAGGNSMGTISANWFNLEFGVIIVG